MAFFNAADLQPDWAESLSVSVVMTGVWVCKDFRSILIASSHMPIVSLISAFGAEMTGLLLKTHGNSITEEDEIPFSVRGRRKKHVNPSVLEMYVAKEAKPFSSKINPNFMCLSWSDLVIHLPFSSEYEWVFDISIRCSASTRPRSRTFGH